MNSPSQRNRALLLLPLLLLTLLANITAAQAQTCENYAFANSDGSCDCPLGFGGPTCSELGCGGTILEGPERPYTSTSSGFANLTQAGCACENGWGGVGCNVCQRGDVCQSAFASVRNGTGLAAGQSDPQLSGVVNGTLTCNTTPRVWAAGLLSCNVQNPTLQAIYPLDSTLNILRTLSPGLSPLPNTTSFGAAGTVHASLIYAGVEQFYCTADACVQQLRSDHSGTDWKCQDLRCTCRTGTSFCGADKVTDLAPVIDKLDGFLDVECDNVDEAAGGTANCSFKQTTLNRLFGLGGLALDGCIFGECVAQGVIDANGTAGTVLETAVHAQLGGGVIAGLAVVGALVFLAAAAFLWGWRNQVAARRGAATSSGAAAAAAGAGADSEKAVSMGGAGQRLGIEWREVGYWVDSGESTPPPQTNVMNGKAGEEADEHAEQEGNSTILDQVSGSVRPGEMMAILGPSGAGKTTLIEILARKEKSGTLAGSVIYASLLPSASSSSLVAGLNRGPSADSNHPHHHQQQQQQQQHIRIGFVPQQDILPAMLTVHESLLFAARLRLPEHVPDVEKHQRVEALMRKLDIWKIRGARIGTPGGDAGGGAGVGGGLFSWLVGVFGGKKRRRGGRRGGKGGRGISGGEARRVSIGLELIARPDVLILDEPTSGLDSVSAKNVADVLYEIAHDSVTPTAVIASIHQPSSQLYQKFDSITLLAHGRTLYSGPGGFAPVGHLTSLNSHDAHHHHHGSSSGGQELVQPCPSGYNVADWLLQVASEASVRLFQVALAAQRRELRALEPGPAVHARSNLIPLADMGAPGPAAVGGGDVSAEHPAPSIGSTETKTKGGFVTTKTAGGDRYATTFLTQLQRLSGREWKILKRDKSLFMAHAGISAVLGVFCGGLYFKTDQTIAGFQSRVGCLFFLGALIAFSSLSALYSVIESRPLFVRERSSSYYSPTAWLTSRFFFDVIPLRIIPTIIVSTITYWMAGLAPDAAHFFKFLFILVLYTLSMTLFNFLLGALFSNGGIAILFSALTALYQMTFAGFFVHLNAIPPVIRWLQWFAVLKYCLEALSVNEVDAGLMIIDKLEGVPVNVSAVLIMNTLFGFGSENYYRDVLVLFAFIAGFGLSVIGVVWMFVRERR